MEPGTPQLTFKRGESEIPLAWTTRSEALLSKHGYDLGRLFKEIGDRRKALFALCVGLHAALPAAVAPDEPIDLAEWLADEAAQAAAMKSLLNLIKFARPELFRKPAEKKSASKP